MSLLLGLLGGLKGATVLILSKLFAKNMMIWLLMFVGEIIVKSTKTPHDNIFLEKLKKVLEE